MDMRAIAFIRSADESRRRRKFGRAWADLVRAEAMARPRLRNPMNAKRILLEMSELPKVSDRFIPKRLEEIADSGEALRILHFLLLDMSRSKSAGTNPGWRQEVDCVTRERVAAADEGDSEAILDLFRPFEPDLGVLFPTHLSVSVMRDYWGSLLAKLGDRHVPEAYDILLERYGNRHVGNDLRRRLQGRKLADCDAVCLLYQAVVRYRSERDLTSKGFHAAVAAAGPANERRLRLAAKRIARVVDYELREALENFDFDLLDEY